MKKTLVSLSAFALTFGFAAAALAQDPPVDTGAESDIPVEEEESSVAINIDVEASSAYVWRGASVWGPAQGDQAFTVFPGLSATFADVTLGYWSAYQLSGDNAGDNVDNALGAEQDLYAGYDGAIGDDMSYSIYATYYFYPMATDYAHFIEPALGFGYSTAVDLGLGLSYFKGIDDAADGLSHIYINPSVGKDIPLTDELALSLGASFGYKILTHELAEQGNNDIDVGLNASMAIPLGDMYIAPGLHGAWSNWETGTQVNVWGGVNVGYDIAL